MTEAKLRGVGLLSELAELKTKKDQSVWAYRARFLFLGSAHEVRCSPDQVKMFGLGTGQSFKMEARLEPNGARMDIVLERAEVVAADSKPSANGTAKSAA